MVHNFVFETFIFRCSIIVQHSLFSDSIYCNNDFCYEHSYTKINI